MIKNWTKIKKSVLQDLSDHGCDIGQYEGDIFLIVPDWDIVEKYPKYFNEADNWGFNDEYAICDGCYNNIFRTQPDCYAWTPEFYQAEDALLCKDCAQDCIEDAIDTIQAAIEDNRQPRSLEWIFDLGEEWKKVENPVYPNSMWENGLYGGQTDSPLKQGQIVQSIRYQGMPLFQIVFRIYPGQFDVEWNTYIRVNHWLDVNLSESEWDSFLQMFGEKFTSKEGQTDYDPARLLEESLKQISTRFTSINTNPETGEINIQGTNDLDEYLNSLKRKV